MDHHGAMLEGGRKEIGRGVLAEHCLDGMLRTIEPNESPNFQSPFLRRNCLWKLLLLMVINTEYSKLCECDSWQSMAINNANILSMTNSRTWSRIAPNKQGNFTVSITVAAAE
jgi:hypothetical protein